MLHDARTADAIPMAVTVPAPVTVRYCHLDDDRDIALRPAAALLSPDETDRAARFRFRRDADRFVRAHGFLRRTLSASTGLGAGQLAFETESNGKPVLACRGVHFNLSHSAGLATVAVSRGGPVGIDVEWIDRRVDIAALAETCFTPDERCVLDALSGDARAERFFAFWTAKEARMKLTGEGMALEPRNIDLALAWGWPVGCRRPADPKVDLRYDEGCPIGAVCCIATTGRWA